MNRRIREVSKRIAVIAMTVSIVAMLVGETSKTYATTELNATSPVVTTSETEATVTLLSDKCYTVVSGDTLSKIAREFYGDYSQYKKIADYNFIKNPSLIFVGQLIKIPNTNSDAAELDSQVVGDTGLPANVQNSEDAIVETPVPTESATPAFKYIDCDLSTDLQDYVNQLCQQYNVPFEMVMGIMYYESRFSTSAYSNGNYGLMQINGCHYSTLKKTLGLSGNSAYDTLMDPHNNILCGVYLLSNLTSTYGADNYHKVLMAYNCGIGGAQRLWKRGIYSSNYSRLIVKKMNEYFNR